MSSYVRRVVDRDPDEHIVYQAFISIWSLLPNFILGVLFLGASVFALMKIEAFGVGQLAIPVTAALGAIGLIFVGHAVAVFYTTEIAITNKQLITKPGIISRDGTTLLLSKCESCNLKQSILGRILDYGSIIVSGAGDTNAVMPGISDPMGFQDSYAHCHKAAKE